MEHGGEIPVGMSGSERLHLIEDALARIIVTDGVEILDGYELPPDNDEVWDPNSVIKGTITILDDNPRIKSFEEPSVFTNRRARASNIALIAIGETPLYITEEQAQAMRKANKNQRGEVIPPSINPLGDKRSARDVDAELAALQSDAPTTRSRRRRTQRRYRSSTDGVRLDDIIGEEAARALGEELSQPPVRFLRPRRPRLGQQH